MTEKTLRGVLIGCGFASWYQLTGWANIEGVEIVAVSSRNRDNADARAEEFGIQSVYTDYREMLDSEDPDFVDIATPPIVHPEMVSEAADRRLAILCQKPAANTLAELAEMVRICDQAGVPFGINENGRFLPWFRQMKTAIDEGRIGKPIHTGILERGRSTLPVADFGPRPWFADMERFLTFEAGVHYLDTLRFLFGEAESVYARMEQVSPHIRGEDLVSMMLRLGGVTGVIDMSWALHAPWPTDDEQIAWGDVRIGGTEGTLHLSPDGVLRLVTDAGVVETWTYAGDSEALAYQGAQQHFIDSLRAGVETETSGRETLKTMELVFGAYDSAENDRIYRVGDDIGRLE